MNMRAKYARQIRHGVLMAQKHHADKWGAPLLDELTDRAHNETLAIQRRERAEFLTTRLEVRAYWATRFKHYGWHHDASRQGAAV